MQKDTSPLAMRQGLWGSMGMKPAGTSWADIDEEEEEGEEGEGEGEQ